MRIDAPAPRDVPSLRTLWQEAFGDSSEFLDAFEKTAFSVSRCRCVFYADEPVAALYWFDCFCQGEKIAYLYAIATAKAYRGHGLCTTLMRDTHAYLKTNGYVGALLVPGGKSLFSFYEKIGYRRCTEIGEIHCLPAAEKRAIRQIGVDEYAKLRRSFLPLGGVLQEDENLAFLQTQATFWTGDGFLLAARCESEHLYGIELLGDCDAAAGIVSALACEDGVFRVPAKGKSFSMYLPLSSDRSTLPSYFGLAFD